MDSEPCHVRMVAWTATCFGCQATFNLWGKPVNTTTENELLAFAVKHASCADA